jgi:hypothetical protein
MAIVLNHTIVPARDKDAAARLFAQIFALTYEGKGGHFAPVKVNDALTFLFSDEDASFESHHYAFHVTDAEFDAIFGRIKQAGLVFGSAPWSAEDGKLNLGRRKGRLLQDPRRAPPGAHDRAAVIAGLCL